MPKPPAKTSSLPLSSDDLANLRESGLTDSTIRDNGLYTVRDDAEKLAQILNCDRTASCCRGGLVIPYRNVEGIVNGFARIRPHFPRKRDGKPIRYEQPRGSSPRAYFPTSSLPAINGGSQDIFITEGEKKALALAQLGIAVIGIGGIYTWKSKDSTGLIPDLDGINWAGRDVYIVFDYDEKPTTRQNVAVAQARLAGALRSANAKEVYAVVLPPGPRKTKQGIDDFLVTQGKQAVTRFNKLVAKAEPIQSAVAPSMLRPSGRTDASNAERVIAKYGQDLHWVGVWDKWVYWDEQRWKTDQSLQIEALAKRVSADLWQEIAKAVSGSTDKSIVDAMVRFAKTSNSVNGIRAMVSLARTEPGVPINVDQLDCDPWLFNVLNGTIDLQSGKLREHRREDFLTKVAPVAFDANATCPRWVEFLDQVFQGKADLVPYIQRLVGYSLSGTTEEHVLPFLYGTGANGKTTFVEAIFKLLGTDYSMKAAPDLLLAKRGECHPTERADLHGRRFVACVETEDGRRLAEALVKELTGGDRMRARRMREDFWEFVPTHHVWLAGNYKPTVNGTDHGIWRRIKLIPFDVTIPNAKQDKKLLSKLAAELPGILNWALAGCSDWQREGLIEPECVKAATSEYSTEMDEVGNFLDEACERGSEFVALATELFHKYQKAGGTLQQRSFGANLRRRGFESTRMTRGIAKAKHAWKGLRLRVGGPD